MKKIILVMIGIFLMTLNGCQSKNEEPEKEEKK
jgi:uncharacterized protein YcfL